MLGIEPPATKPAWRWCARAPRVCRNCSRMPCTARLPCTRRMAGGAELASRDHIRRVLPLTQQVLTEANQTFGERGRSGLYARPRTGWRLVGGAGVACALAQHWASRCWGAPPGRAFAVAVSAPIRRSFPSWRCWSRRAHAADACRWRGQYTLLGETIDDAAGEAFDKSAKLMGLPYPGGPYLRVWPSRGQGDASKLPRPLLHSGDLDFSFAGLEDRGVSAGAAPGGCGWCRAV